MTITELTNELLNWLREEDNIVLDEFFVKYGLTMRQAEQKAKLNNKFKETLLFAKDTIYARLVAGALTKRFNHSFVTYLLKSKSETNDEKSTLNLDDKALRERLITLAESVLNELSIKQDTKGNKQ